MGMKEFRLQTTSCSPSEKYLSSSAGHEIFCVILNSNSGCRVQNTRALLPILNSMDLDHILVLQILNDSLVCSVLSRS